MVERSVSASKAIRCAIYTRKSSEEGLEQDFNSLHAQREACEAYIASQRHEGWKLVATPYDDGGYSGGSMERPGLKALLADIQAGQVDVVVVYKVDRLTRSLTDFARIVESFDARGVSFVSVTQSFNTTSSMGRLTLNVLLSFAQFEREVTGERIRDKIAASKRKGLWMGGIPPIGYRAEGRSLEIVAEEADIVRRIFDQYIALRSVADLKVELDRDVVLTRAYSSASDRQWGGKPFSIGHLRSILRNPVYIGDIVHKGQRFKGQHQPIVERGCYAEVQQILALTGHRHRLRLDADQANLFAGLVVDSTGRRFTSSHTSKKGLRYRYYVLGETCEAVAKADRIPAGDLEILVIAKLSRALTDQNWIIAAAGDTATPDQISSWIEAGAALTARLGSLDDQTQREAVAESISRITIGSDTIEIDLRATALGKSGVHDGGPGDLPPLRLTIANTLAPRPRDIHLMIKADEIRPPKPTKWLIKGIARGVTWYEELKTGAAASLGEIAKREDVTERYVAQLIRLAFLKPDIVKAVLGGTAAPRITGADVSSGRELPLVWAEQQEAYF